MAEAACMRCVEDRKATGQAGEPHTLKLMSVTEDVSNPDTSWLKALAPENTAWEHSQAQPYERQIAVVFQIE